MFFIEEHRAANQLKALHNPAILVKPSPPPRGNTSSNGGKWGRGGGASGGWNSGGGGWRDTSGGERRVSFQRGESSDMMEEDTTSVLLVSGWIDRWTNDYYNLSHYYVDIITYSII